MPKITKVNIAAARAQRDILRRSGKQVPAHVERLASTKLTDEQAKTETGVVSAAANNDSPAKAG